MSLVKRAYELQNDMFSLRREIHAFPELAFQEFKTTELIERSLKSYGIETFPNGDKTGVIGILKGAKPGRTIALRADIDALPVQEASGLPYASTREGLSHACGHDIHTAALLGAARLLSELKNEICGTIKFLFQPAEESTNGAKSMIANGALDNPRVDAIICAHTWPDIPGGSIGVRKGAMLAAADSFKININGKGGHAAHPHKCVDPIVVGAYIITQLQTVVSREVSPTDSAVVTVGKMIAGTASNIIPSQAIIEGTFRTVSKETRGHIKDSIARIAKLTAESLNAVAEVEFGMGVPPTICDPEIVDIASEAVIQLLGEDKLLPLAVPSMGAEDFAEYLEFVPGALLRLGTADERPESRFALHSPKVVFDEQSIVAGAIAFVGTVFKLTGSDFTKLL